MSTQSGPGPQNAAADRRIKDLLGQLSLAEKVGQMSQRGLDKLEVAGGKVTDASLEQAFGTAGAGIICVSPRDDWKTTVLKINAAQDYLKKKTKHKLPALVVSEAIHGVVMRGATIFPQALAAGCTWNIDLVREMAAAIASEASALGITQCLSPVLDLGRDPRVGRIEQCFGECPTLVGAIGVAYIKGMQGKHAEQSLAPNKVLCTAKHFAAASVPENGINSAPAPIGERAVRSLHLVPFETAIRQAGLACIMPACNEIDGVPCHASPWLLTKVLRDEWKFDGYVCSGWGGVGFNVGHHRVAANKQDAARLALAAGVDLEAPVLDCFASLVALAEEGKVKPEAIDRAAGRVLRVKLLAGLLEGARPPVDANAVSAKLRPSHHVALARRIAAESVVLLKNARNLLPLSVARHKKIAVIGPNADQVQFGDCCWSKNNADGVTVLQGIKALVGTDATVDYAKGCDLVGRSPAGIPDAVELAKRSDVAIVVIGDTSMTMSGSGSADASVPVTGTVGEGFDVNDPVPPGIQLELVKSIQASGTPTVVVMLHGRPFSVPWIKEHVPAILDAFYPGEQQGAAIADILFGKVNPSGRLPVSVAQSAGHIPTVYDYKPTSRGQYHQPGSAEKMGRDYVCSSPAPLWPFGHGVHYTRFEYSNLKVAAPKVKLNATVKFSVTVTNTGQCAGKEVVQVYVRDVVSSVTSPVMRLIRFEKVELKPKDKHTCAFEILPVELALWNNAMQCVVESGAFELLVGSSSEDIRQKGSFEIV